MARKKNENIQTAKVSDIKKSYDTSGVGLATSTYYSGEAIPKVMPNSYLEQFYTKDDVIRQCVDAVAFAVAGSGYHFFPKYYREVNKAQQTVLEFFFENPNADDTFDDLVTDITMDLGTYGNAFLYIHIKNNSDLMTFKEWFRNLKTNDKINVYELEFPFSLHKASALNMKIFVDSKGHVIKYVQQNLSSARATLAENKELTPDKLTSTGVVLRTGGLNQFVDVTFLPSQMIHIRVPSPLDEPAGLSPSATLSNSVGADLFATEYNAKFFENNATPRLHFDLGACTDEDLARFKGVAIKELRGQPHKNIITKGGVKIEPIGLTNQEMEFSDYIKHLRERMMSTFRVQPIILGLTEISGNSTDNQISLFKFLAVDPIRKIICGRINKKLISIFFPGTDLRLVFNPIDRLDSFSQSRIDTSYLQTQVKTINEVRAEKGLDPVAWGDSPVIPFSDAASAILPKENSGRKSKKEGGKNEEK